MDMVDIILGQILSPPILFFALGMFACLVKSDLKIPEAMSTAMILFLLVGIGLEGGVGVAKAGIAGVILPALAAIFMGVGIVLLGYAVLRKLKFGAANAGSIAGHYGAVSAVTMILGFYYLRMLNVEYEPFLPALYPFMDSSAIITAILLARMALAKKDVVDKGIKLKPLKIAKEGFVGRAVLLLLSSMLIGFIAGTDGTAGIMPFFDGMFVGVLCLFMLDMGILAAGRLSEWKVVGHWLVIFAFVMPVVHGILGTLLGTLVGLSIGGASMLGILSASGSYISAPAAMRAAVPEANPSFALTASVALTFPFNVIIGIPLYHAIAVFWAGIF